VRLGRLTIIDECFFCPLHVIEVLKRLVVYPKLKVVPVLHYVEHVRSYLKRVLERGAELLSFKYETAISEHLLLATEVTANQLYSHEDSV